MRDPHVEALYFDLIPAQGSVTIANPPPVEWAPEHGRARYLLKDRTLTAWPLIHTATAEEARALVQPDLKRWEDSAELDAGAAVIRFRYKGARFSDRRIASGDGHSVSTGAGEASAVLPRYPAPPTAFNAESALVRELMNRFRNRSHEPLLTFVYSVLSHIEAEAGPRRRKDAASKYRVDMQVLRTLGELSSENRSGPGGARKRKPGVTPIPLTSGEVNWLEKAIPAVILQVAAVEAGAEPEPLTMDKLPPL